LIANKELKKVMLAYKKIYGDLKKQYYALLNSGKPSCRTVNSLPKKKECQDCTSRSGIASILQFPLASVTAVTQTRKKGAFTIELESRVRRRKARN
jgi:hypothetical protein